VDRGDFFCHLFVISSDISKERNLCSISSFLGRYMTSIGLSQNFLSVTVRVEGIMKTVGYQGW